VNRQWVRNMQKTARFTLSIGRETFSARMRTAEDAQKVLDVLANSCGGSGSDGSWASAGPDRIIRGDVERVRESEGICSSKEGL
jgi:hypothetical protein